MPSRIEATAQGKPTIAYSLTAKRAIIGRAEDADLKVDHDLHLSRKHAEVWMDGGRLRVKRLPGAANPVYHSGIPRDEFALAPGEHFVIGRTRFMFVSDVAPAVDLAATSPQPIALKTISAKDLYAINSESDRLRLLDLLELPEILRSRDRQDFHVHIANLLRMATGAIWACVATEHGDILGEASEAHAVGAHYKPSRQLIKKALDDAPSPTLYTWGNTPKDVMATVHVGLDWAACAAARIPNEPALIFYAAGRGQGNTQGPSPRRDEARFVGLVADMVGRSVAVDRLSMMEGRLERFFSGPVVDKILKSPDMKELEPRLAQSTILFFDIRGFSKRTEENTQILSHISDLRHAMTAMTGIILEERGVVLQYMGDGIMACWNVPFADESHADLACRAALRMAEAFPQTTGGWGCGIGIHTGEVVAGAIGSEQIFSYGVLGGVVNQASRVEGITKALSTQILVTREVAEKVSHTAAHCLRVGRFRPAGMTMEVDLFLLEKPPGDLMRADVFRRGLDAFQKGDFAGAAAAFAQRPPEDGPAAFLREKAEAYAKAPPPDWRGVIELTQK